MYLSVGHHQQPRKESNTSCILDLVVDLSTKNVGRVVIMKLPFCELTYTVSSPATFEDDYLFPKMGYVSSLEGNLMQSFSVVFKINNLYPPEN